jgi:hypothetical protein
MAILDRRPVYKEEIRVSHTDLALARSGRKKCTIRLGTASVVSPSVCLTDGHDRLAVWVTGVDTARMFSELTEADAASEGLASLEALKADLDACYGAIEPAQPISVIHFRTAP